MRPIERNSAGFTLQTPTSINVPGRWGFLPLVWEPAALIADVSSYRIFQSPHAKRE